jgi:aryl-alcohol dehydrogenase-like predicted oxidoreductase
VYQGKWHAGFRDMEAEIIPMCQDQGMAIVPWEALGGGALQTKEQQEKAAGDPKARKPPTNETTKEVSAVLEDLAQKYDTTIQAMVGYRS